MFNVCNNKDYRIGWEILYYARERVKEPGGNTHRRRKRIVSLKRDLRRYANREAAVDVGLGFKCERQIIKDYGMDGYIELVSIPEVFDTLEGEDGANEFFKEFLEIHARPSMYDCTGQAFTSWYKLFKRRGQFYAYHSVCFDV